MPLHGSLFIDADLYDGDSYSDDRIVTAGTATLPVDHKVPGAQYERLTVARVNLTTDAAAGVRTPTLRAIDQDNTVLWFSTAPAGQNPNVSSSYLWSPFFSAALGTVDSAQEMPWPDVLLEGGWRLSLNVSNADAGDLVTLFVIQLNVFPTGPARITATAPATPTPVLL